MRRGVGLGLLSSLIPLISGEGARETVLPFFFLLFPDS